MYLLVCIDMTILSLKHEQYIDRFPLALGVIVHTDGRNSSVY